METRRECLYIMSQKNDDCELSVVVRVYNSSGTLHKCLEAIRVSDFNDYEYILIDDTSKDRSADIARE
jgi:glycosyltransferase involved in cell wall biosynthesis